MKGSEFINLMRKVIREEVRAVVKDELGYIKTLIAESKTKQPEYKAPQQRPAAPVRRSQPIVQLDGVLGDILRETQESMLNESAGYSAETEEWSHMGELMTSDHVPSMAQMMAPPTMQSNRFDPDPTAAFVKDYSAVMKAADAHQGKI